MSRLLSKSWHSHLQILERRTGVRQQPVEAKYEGSHFIDLVHVEPEIVFNLRAMNESPATCDINSLESGSPIQA